MDGNIDKLGQAVRHLNANINEIATIITTQQELRDRQLLCILGILKEIGEVPDDTVRLLTQRVSVTTKVSRIEDTSNDISQIPVKNGLSGLNGRSNNAAISRAKPR